MALYGSQESKRSRPQYESRDLHAEAQIQIQKEETRQATMLLESNADVMTALREYYVKLLDNADFLLRTDCRQNIQDFAVDVESEIVLIRMQVRRLGLLAGTISERQDQVCSMHFQRLVTTYLTILDRSTRSETGRRVKP
jgi:hypothetical protein